MTFVQFFLLLSISFVIGKSKKEPFKNEKPIYATKTAYGWLPEKNDFFSNPPELHGKVQYRNQNCSAMHVYTILRHGARNPGLRDTKHMADLQQRLGKIKSFSPVTEHLKNWKSPFVESEEGQLIKLGRYEHIQNAHHFMAAFDHLFLENQRLQPLRLVSSTKPRCVDSMKAFADGVKEYAQAHKLDIDDFDKKVKMSNNNTLLRFFDYCAKYQKDVKRNKAAMAEYHKFIDGKYIGEVVKKVNQEFRVENNFFDSPRAILLGRKREYHKFIDGKYIGEVVKKVNQEFRVEKNFFDSHDVRVMYVLCAFEQCLLNSSDWCRLLNHEDNLRFEYLSDIKQYWINAYGYKVNYLQSCPIMKDLLFSVITSVKAHRTGSNYTKGNFMFGHGETLGPVYSDLGLFKDNMPLNAGNFKEHKVNRRFRSSYLIPFASNIAVVTYHCASIEGMCMKRNNNDISMEQATDYVVQMYLNERLIEIPQCGTTCPLDQFINKYKKIESCEFNKVCHLNKSS